MDYCRCPDNARFLGGSHLLEGSGAGAVVNQRPLCQLTK